MPQVEARAPAETNCGHAAHRSRGDRGERERAFERDLRRRHWPDGAPHSTPDRAAAELRRDFAGQRNFASSRCCAAFRCRAASHGAVQVSRYDETRERDGRRHATRHCGTWARLRNADGRMQHCSAGRCRPAFRCRAASHGAVQVSRSTHGNSDERPLTCRGPSVRQRHGARDTHRMQLCSDLWMQHCSAAWQTQHAQARVLLTARRRTAG